VSSGLSEKLRGLKPAFSVGLRTGVNINKGDHEIHEKHEIHENTKRERLTGSGEFGWMTRAGASPTEGSKGGRGESAGGRLNRRKQR
jgi:hypothetical protein